MLCKLYIINNKCLSSQIEKGVPKNYCLNSKVNHKPSFKNLNVFLKQIVISAFINRFLASPCPTNLSSYSQQKKPQTLQSRKSSSFSALLQEKFQRTMDFISWIIPYRERINIKMRENP